MEEENIYNMVRGKLKERRQNVRIALQKRFAHTTPYGMEKLTDKRLIEAYDNMKEQDWYDALDKFGIEKVDAFKSRVEALKGGKR